MSEQNTATSVDEPLSTEDVRPLERLQGVAQRHGANTVATRLSEWMTWLSDDLVDLDER